MDEEVDEEVDEVTKSGTLRTLALLAAGSVDAASRSPSAGASLSTSRAPPSPPPSRSSGSRVETQKKRRFLKLRCMAR